MQFLEEYKPAKKFKVSDEDLFDIVISDKNEAERYFDASIAEGVIMRYNLTAQQ